MIVQFKINNIDILDVLHCPHKPSSQCNCRKPKPGMLLQAKKRYKINMKESWVIGDKEIDILAAKNAGISNSILVKSGHKIDESSTKAMFIINSIKDIRNIVKF